MNIPDFLIRRESRLTPLSLVDLSRVLEFKRRAESFESSMKRYYIGAIAKHSSSDDLNLRKRSFEANTPDVDHIQNLALKFRFFYAEKEPTRVETIISILRKSAEDEWARNYLDSLRAQYNGAMKRSDMSDQMGLPVSNREIISLWFNSEFFHSDFDKREKLNEINRSISEKVSLFQLYTAITGVSTLLKSLYAVVHKVTEDYHVIYTPNHHFTRKVSVKASHIHKNDLLH
ncbi:Putative uncharacterized protein [Moritella viscosa]|uniref:hypothetical protein n=1 Tax=Moritella viscosa TaxID=80854 RepID=UPI00090F576A|nr:hypothetical protein [Moritella viscosa]SHO21934.1 Putative uncharacterized protein [Moritella viscosa]